MAAPRPSKGRKPFNDNSSPVQGSRGSRGTAWRGGSGPNYSNAARPNTQFPPLAGSLQRTESGYDPKLLSTLATMTGSPVIITLKSGARHEGTVAAIIGEGDAAGVSLKDSRDPSNPAAVVRESLVLSASSITSWQPRMPNGTESFRTDTDISNGATSGPRQRELQPWQQDINSATATSLAALGDEATFGPPVYSGQPWDQFEANERLFGVTANFEEDKYTTKINRDAPGFKERERKAEQIANEITSGSSNNPHVAEERVMNGTENGMGEEERYSAVARAPNVYVPPGARRGGPPSAAPQAATQQTATPQAVDASTPPATNGTAAAPTITATPSGPSTTGSAPEDASKAEGGLVSNFREFVNHEKQRLAQRKQAMVKTEMDKRKADLLKFSKNFKLNRPIPDDLVPILAKDEEKQKAIREKAAADLLVAQNRPANSGDGPSKTTASVKPSVPQDAAKAATKPATQVDSQAKKVKTSMIIQVIPPFDKSKVRKAAATPAAPVASGPAASSQPSQAPVNGAPVPPASPSGAQAQANTKLNPTASVFKPNFKPMAPAQAPPAKQTTKDSVQTGAAAAGPPNPFYGPRAPTKKGASVHLKEEFNPFRQAKVGDASQVSSIWPYNGKRFAALHPPPQPPAMHAVPSIPNPLTPGMPLPPHEEDPNMQQGPGQRPLPPQQQQQQPPAPLQQAPQPQHQPPPGYPMMYYPPYPPYSPAPPGQPPMMMPPNSPYMAAPYMHPVAYPHHMPPNGSMYGHPPPGMQGVPQTPQYMSHTPFAQASPPQAGTPRGPGPMPPPQQMPPHPYYHPSPQLTHAMPYGMMMQPPGPHFDPAQGPPQAPAQPTQMGH